MLTAAKNYDVICLQMRSYLPQQDLTVKSDTVGFIDEVKAILASSALLKPAIDRFIPQVFNFRIRALKWLATQVDLDMQGAFDSAMPSIRLLLSNPRLIVLGENMMFAMRCNMRVVKAIVNQTGINSYQMFGRFAEIPSITYEQFLGTLAMSTPDDATVQAIADWLHASLYIEFIMLAGILIDEENISVSETRVNELAFLIADAAQEYFAIASQMGILEPRDKATTTTVSGVTSQFDEDKLLADIGLSDFALNF